MRSSSRLLKIVLQPVYGLDIVDSVKSCFLVALCDVSDTRCNLGSIFALLPSLDLTDPGNIFTSDLKVFIGYKISHNKFN